MDIQLENGENVGRDLPVLRLQAGELNLFTHRVVQQNAAFINSK